MTLAGLNFSRGPGKNILVRSCFIGIDIWQDGMFFFFFFFFFFFSFLCFCKVCVAAKSHSISSGGYSQCAKKALPDNRSLPFTFFIHCLHCSWLFASTDLSYFLEAVPPCFVWVIEKFLNNCLLCVEEGGCHGGGEVWGAVGARPGLTGGGGGWIRQWRMRTGKVGG